MESRWPSFLAHTVPWPGHATWVYSFACRWRLGGVWEVSVPCGHREGPCCEQAGTNLYGTCLHFSRVCTRVALPGHVLPPAACGGRGFLEEGRGFGLRP